MMGAREEEIGRGGDGGGGRGEGGIWGISLDKDTGTK